jgi:hypothetical protein
VLGDAWLSTANTRNAILSDGLIDNLILKPAERLVVRNHETAVTVTGSMYLDEGSALELRFDNTTWGSTIRVSPEPTLGGTLALHLTADADTEAMVGAELPAFRWNGAPPHGERFDQIVSQPGVAWDTQQLYTTGSVRLVDVAQLMAGDANMDYEFNQLDLVQVLIAGKYLTGRPSTWGEGDWNGAPGGWWRHPPEGDGVFDQLDIVAALEADTYLTGPYATVGGDDTAVSAVPEAATIPLLVLGLIAIAMRHSMRRKEPTNGPY